MPRKKSRSKKSSKTMWTFRALAQAMPLKHALFASLSIVFFALMVWFLVVGKMDTYTVSSAPAVHRSPHMPKPTTATAVNTNTLASLEAQQNTPELKEIVRTLGSAKYQFPSASIALQNGVYTGVMHDSRVNIYLSDVFFSPTDKTGTELAVATLTLRNEDTGDKKSVTYYIFVRLPNGTLSRGVADQCSVPVSGVSIQNGIVTVTHGGDSQNGACRDSVFAITKKEGDPLPTLESVSPTVMDDTDEPTNTSITTEQ